MKKIKTREDYEDWDESSMPPPPSGLPLKRKVEKKEKSGRELYEDKVWRVIDEMPPPPSSWPLDNWPERKEIKSTQKEVVRTPVHTLVRTGVCTNGKKQQESIEILKNKIDNLIFKSEGKEIKLKSRGVSGSIKRGLFVLMFYVRISLVMKKMILELSRELGVHQSEVVRMSISLLYAMVIKKEKFLWQ